MKAACARVEHRKIEAVPMGGLFFSGGEWYLRADAPDDDSRTFPHKGVTVADGIVNGWWHGVFVHYYPDARLVVPPVDQSDPAP